MSLLTKIRNIITRNKTEVQDPTNTTMIDVTRNTLYIYLAEGQKISWSTTPWQGMNISEPWKDFMNWYFTFNTPAFLMKAQEGDTMIRRDSIISFKTRLDQVKVPAPQTEVKEQ